MKKAILIFLSLTMLLSASACSSNIEGSESNSSEEIVQIAEPIQLENKMTETERSRVDKHALTLLDEPVDPADIVTKVSIEFKTQTIDEMLSELEAMRDEITDEQYEQTIEEISELAKDGTNEYCRFTYLVQERDKLLDFITDNLMPYLGENYNIDYANSSLYGHSNGGVFTHNALFKSDLYENQPFGNYIIGSPAFWGLYDEYFDLDPEGCQNDYGYFDRNDTLDKKVFLCGGSLENPDYADSYNGQNTTLEGLAKLNERLESHKTYRLYESHHYQFIPEMLI
ncbi:MAG: hypothetical protein NC320_11730 [Clostridium sp.]|nr:hypothetical protein [Clostridium sp.]